MSYVCCSSLVFVLFGVFLIWEKLSLPFLSSGIAAIAVTLYSVACWQVFFRKMHLVPALAFFSMLLLLVYIASCVTFLELHRAAFIAAMLRV